MSPTLDVVQLRGVTVHYADGNAYDWQALHALGRCCVCLCQEHYAFL